MYSLARPASQLQAGAFAEGKFTRWAQGDIAFEEEVMQEVARLCFVEWGDRLDGLQGAEIWIEQFLFLCHVPEFGRAAQAEAARERGNHPNNRADEGCFARAVWTCQHDALTCADEQVDVFKQGIFWRVAN